MKITEHQLRNIINESIKRVLMENNINEVSNKILQNAVNKAHYDSMQTNNYGFQRKRNRQYKAFKDELMKRNHDEKNLVCPYVNKSELKNLPKDTYVIMDGAGRDAYSNFTYTYSGHAGTKEQCMEFVNKYYDDNSNWEFMPQIVSLEEYFKYYA